MKKLLQTFLFWAMTAIAYAEDEIPSAAESLLPKTGNMPSYEGTFIKMLLTLGGLLSLVFLTIWVLRKVSHGRFGGFGNQKKIIILEKKPISPKTLLYLIELEGKKILISESQLDVRTISHPQPEDLYE